MAHEHATGYKRCPCNGHGVGYLWLLLLKPTLEVPSDIELIDTPGAITNSLPWEHIQERNLFNYRWSQNVPILQTLVILKILFSLFWWRYVLSFFTAMRTHTGEKLAKWLVLAEVIHWTSMLVMTKLISLFRWCYALHFFSAMWIHTVKKPLAAPRVYLSIKHNYL